MKNILYKLIVTAGMALGLTSFNAHAGLMGTSVGAWSNPQGTAYDVTIVNGDPYSQISWGKSAGYGKSSWIFGGLSDFEAYTDGTMFAIGSFHHYNNPIYRYNFTGADLDLTLTLGSEVLTPSFFFGHEETLNRATPCPYGTNPCADIVSLSPLTSTDTVTIGGMVYEMTLAGFYIHPDIYSDILVTDEHYDNWAYLYASLSKVPEPSIIALFSIGLLGLGFASRRKAHG